MRRYNAAKFLSTGAVHSGTTSLISQYSLNNYFEPEIERLEEFLGHNLDMWRPDLC